MTPDNPLIENGKMELLTFEGTLTKRERFAMAAMQGLCANPHHDPHCDWVVIAEWAVNHADCLIKEIETTPEPK